MSKSKKLSLVLTNPRLVHHLPPPEFIKKVYAMRINTVKYLNVGPHDTLTVSIEDMTQNYFSDGIHNYRDTLTVFLGPHNSTAMYTNQTGYDFYKKDGSIDTLSELQIKLLLDKKEDNSISELNPVFIQLEFFYH